MIHMIEDLFSTLPHFNECHSITAGENHLKMQEVKTFNIGLHLVGFLIIQPVLPLLKMHWF